MYLINAKKKILIHVYMMGSFWNATQCIPKAFNFKETNVMKNTVSATPTKRKRNVCIDIDNRKKFNFYVKNMYLCNYFFLFHRVLYFEKKII